MPAAPDVAPRPDAFGKVGLEEVEPFGKGIGIQAGPHNETRKNVAGSPKILSVSTISAIVSETSNAL